jgi:hypothetical protein
MSRSSSLPDRPAPPSPCAPALAVWRAIHAAAQAGVRRDEIAKALHEVEALGPAALAVVSWVGAEARAPSQDDHNLPRRSRPQSRS